MTATMMKLAAVLGRPFTWLPDRAGLLVKTVPAARADDAKARPADTRPAVPTGPNVQETSGKSSPLRTYPDLLRTSADEAMF